MLKHRHTNPVPGGAGPPTTAGLPVWGRGVLPSYVELMEVQMAVCSLPAPVSFRERGEEGVGQVTCIFHIQSLQ